MNVAGEVNSRPLLPDTYYVRCGKRLLDLVLAVFGIAALSPLMAVCALLVKLSSPGPIIFVQTRVGREGELFNILKFRTMIVDDDQAGHEVTAAGDRRITRIGKHLRKLKLDELPQLWNVFKGEMSLVGPRPEVPRYVAIYTKSQRQVLRVRPGITDAATLMYRHEEAVLARNPNSEKYYKDVILPHKLELNMQYLNRISFSYDLHLIFRTFWSVFSFGQASVG